MRSYAALMGLMVGLLLAVFAVVQAFDVALLTDPGPTLSDANRFTAAAVGTALLVGDVVLPVPSSLVMIAHGAVFGAIGGAALSLAGAVAASAVGFAIGRRAEGLIRRFIPGEERERADRLLGRWGLVTVAATRPVPLLAETVAVLAGTTRLGWRPYLAASLAGSVPAAVLYAVTGATSARLDNGLVVFGVVMGVASVVYLVGRRLGRAAAAEAERV